MHLYYNYWEQVFCSMFIVLIFKYWYYAIVYKRVTSCHNEIYPQASLSMHKYFYLHSNVIQIIEPTPNFKPIKNRPFHRSLHYDAHNIQPHTNDCQRKLPTNKKRWKMILPKQEKRIKKNPNEINLISLEHDSLWRSNDDKYPLYDVCMCIYLVHPYNSHKLYVLYTSPFNGPSQIKNWHSLKPTDALLEWQQQRISKKKQHRSEQSKPTVVAK